MRQEGQCDAAEPTEHGSRTKLGAQDDHRLRKKKHADCERTAPKLTPRWTRLSAFGSRWHGHHLAASDGPGALIGLPGGPCGLVRSGQVGQTYRR